MTTHKLIRKRVEEALRVDLNKRKPSGKHDRSRRLVYARSIYYRLLYEFTNMGVTEMGNTLGQHHATVLHAKTEVFQAVMRWGDDEFAELYYDVRRQLMPVKEQMEEEVRKALSYRSLLKENARLNSELRRAILMVNDPEEYRNKYGTLKVQIGRLKWLLNEDRFLSAKEYVKEIENIKV